MADKPKKKNWIKSAVKPENKGKFTAKAEAAGKSVQEYAREKASAPGTLGKEARLAKAFAGMAHKRKRSPLYDSKD